jgi:ubiquinone/menaquinone biosynthesis C-methylase UbiE
MNKWTEQEHVLSYLNMAGGIPHRTEGERVLLDHIPCNTRRVLDLGCGDGRLLALVFEDRPFAEGVAVDFSRTMLENARRRFSNSGNVTILEHNLDHPLPDLGRFDAVVSSFAIHHCTHERKRSLYQEAFAILEPNGIFCNLEHVSSPTARLHHRFLESLGQSVESEDPSKKLLDMETQLSWLRAIGFSDVDCYWKWLELALLIGYKPAG